MNLKRDLNSLLALYPSFPHRLVHGYHSRGARPRDSTGGRLERRQKPSQLLCPHVYWTGQKKMGTRTRFSTAQQRKPNADSQLVLKKLKRRTGTVK